MRNVSNGMHTDPVKSFYLFFLQNYIFGLTIYRLYTAITRERSTLAFVPMTYGLSLSSQRRVIGLGIFPR
jgi:hypothetical protein